MLTVTTNTISEWRVQPEHSALNAKIVAFAEQGLPMQAVADTLNAEGVLSVTGKPFYAELVGALLSKARRKNRGRHVSTVVDMMLV